MVSVAGMVTEVVVPRSQSLPVATILKFDLDAAADWWSGEQALNPRRPKVSTSAVSRLRPHAGI